jgi:hypothetical protein
MAFKHGKSTSVWFGSKDLSAYFNSSELSVETEASDTTVFAATWRTGLTGTMGAKASLGGFYDPTLTDLTATLGGEFGYVLTISPAGAIAIGDRARLLSVASTAYAESSEIGGIIAVKWEPTASGTVGFGDVLHINTEDTNTTTGATKDDTAATATGWVAHLHVTAIDAGGGSWVVKLQDASASNFSDGADVTGGAFTAATTVTSQRLVSATGTTALRRYVRYIATRTGGSAGEGITFGLAYARNF